MRGDPGAVEVTLRGYVGVSVRSLMPLTAAAIEDTDAGAGGGVGTEVTSRAGGGRTASCSSGPSRAECEFVGEEVFVARWLFMTSFASADCFACLRRVSIIGKRISFYTNKSRLRRRVTTENRWGHRTDEMLKRGWCKNLSREDEENMYTPDFLLVEEGEKVVTELEMGTTEGMVE